MSVESPLLTVEEAAGVCRLNKFTLYRLIKRRRVGGVVRIGRKILLHRPLLEAWLQRKAAEDIGERARARRSN